jgi:hypothetical protein
MSIDILWHVFPTLSRTEYIWCHIVSVCILCQFFFRTVHMLCHRPTVYLWLRFVWYAFIFSRRHSIWYDLTFVTFSFRRSLHSLHHTVCMSLRSYLMPIFITATRSEYILCHFFIGTVHILYHSVCMPRVLIICSNPCHVFSFDVSFTLFIL